ncbi:TIGR00659 family protein [Andreprevotia lacus DSM 23236]|jgi:predicted murein hydrolase (TIGR00659 family)|uniref:TIGR00659 family protein n=1 Tax=Andreprevotia lacus DSM 23236 TaxID=1121001 RepID=A0A1W1WWJ1_9NEIS|nr:LrgB family protein [Andreprevotia lacus]SMC15994.1 TIGR00659 family protein [Andreprevotia lacus DSM 23236]
MNAAAWLAPLKAAPLLWLAVTAFAYLLAEKLYRHTRHFPLLHPVLVAIVLVAGLLLVLGVPYPDYFAGARPLHWLLGPATVALAVPLFDNLQRVRSLLAPLMIALLVGGVVGIVSALGLAHLFGLSWPVQLSFAPKSVTTPIAMALAEHLGGLPALTANVVIITGVVGAVAVVPLLRLLRVDGDVERGFALGVAAHGVGTARAFQLSPTAGAFAGLAMGLNGVWTSVVLPLVLAFWPH